MNSFDTACAILSAVAYKFRVDDQNKIQPVGATILPGSLGYVNNTASGFEASAYEYQGKIVVAYAGTNTGQWADLIADGVMGVGLPHDQLLQAAEFYLSIKNDPRYAGKEIVFTGHSLGGGLAAAMGVFFNKQAVTFDPANFRLAVTKSNADLLKETLALAHPGWPADPDLASYYTTEGVVGVEAPLASAALAAVLATVNPILSVLVATMAYPIVIRGEGQIKAYSVSGEFLTNGYQGVLSGDLNKLRIQSGTTPELIVVNPVDANLGLFDLHSMTLLIVAAMEPRLAVLFNQRASLTEALFDKGLYHQDSSSSTADFLTKLVQEEFRNASSIAGTGYLGKFADDLERIGANADGVAGQPAVQKALTIAAMEYYYFKNSTTATALFTSSGNGIHFKYSDIGGTISKALPRLTNAVNAYLSNDELRELGAITDLAQIRDDVGTGRLMGQNSWHIQTGTAGMVWTAAGNDKDAAIGGAQTDILDAGAGDDILIGGAGQDFLTGGAGADTVIGGVDVDWLDGGAGNDKLLGGQGADNYIFADAFGSDVVYDSDGQGSINVNGTVLTGGKKKPGESTYRDAATGSSYVLVGSTLLVSKSGSPQITIENWSKTKNLGITLVVEVDPPPPPAPPRPRDPLVIDLDGDGLELRAADGQVLFDHNADGIRTGTGWAEADDGLLVWDRNGNGLIDSGRELFGVDTLKNNGQYAANGFDALADLDSDADGLFNNSDAQFNNLRVWRDLDQDGVTDAGELQSLAAAGIAGISLNTSPNGSVINNNRVDSTSTVMRTDGSNTVAGAIDFAQNLMAREFTSQTVAGHITISDTAQALPELRGSGMVRDLQEAVSLGTVESAALAYLLQQYAQATSRDAQVALLEPLLNAWAATSTQQSSINTSAALAVAASGTGSETAVQAWARLNPVAHQNVATLERFYGSNFLERWVVAVAGGNVVNAPPSRCFRLTRRGRHSSAVCTADW